MTPNPADVLSFPNNKKQSGLTVTVESNPIPTKISIDGAESITPLTTTLKPGLHVFVAADKVPDPNLTYGFDRWTINGETVSYDRTATLKLTGPCEIKAEYIIAESGIYPLAITNQVPTM